MGIYTLKIDSLITSTISEDNNINRAGKKSVIQTYNIIFYTIYTTSTFNYHIFLLHWLFYSGMDIQITSDLSNRIVIYLKKNFFI